MRRRKLVAAVVGLAALVAVGTFVLRPGPSSRITRENLDRIQDGMSLQEVEAILGPRGDYRTGPTKELPWWVTMTDRPLVDAEVAALWEGRTLGDGGRQHTWQGDGGELWLLLGPEGVRAKNFMATEKAPQSALDNLLWRAKRQWRRWFPE
jgi:hypothetical protein